MQHLAPASEPLLNPSRELDDRRGMRRSRSNRLATLPVSFVLALALAAGLAAGSAAAGGFYTWTDENGKVHFSDTPRHAEAEKLEVGKRGNVQTMKKATPAQQAASRKRLSDLEQRRKRLQNQANRNGMAKYELKRPALKEPSWRQRAIDSCKSGGFRKNCESEKQIQKRRPVPEAKRQKRRERYIKQQERRMRNAWR